MPVDSRPIMICSFENKAILENDVVFSGLDLYVPSHWNVEDQTGKVFSSHNIGRTINPGNPTLILRGDVVFGGIKVHYI